MSRRKKERQNRRHGYSVGISKRWYQLEGWQHTGPGQWKNVFEFDLAGKQGHLESQGILGAVFPDTDVEANGVGIFKSIEIFPKHLLLKP